MREEIEYETYIDKQGRVERTTRLYFDTLEQMQTYIEGLNGEYPKGFYGSTTLKMVVLCKELVPISEYFAWKKAKEQEE